MKKINLIILLFTGILISCSSNETPIVKTDLELLTEKKWDFDHFEFVSSSNNTNNYSKEEIEEEVDNLYLGNIEYTFNSDKTGELNINTENRIFTWNLANEKLDLYFSNDDYDTEYIMNSINETELNITFNHESIIFIQGNETSIKGNYYYK